MQTTDPQSASSHSHPIRIAVSDHDVTSTQLENLEVTFDELLERFSDCTAVGEKGGSYFVRGPLKDGCTTRADANIAHSELIVLDCDSQFNPLTGDVTEGAPPLASIHDALASMGVSHIIATTHSHQQKGKGTRCRALIPTPPMTPEQLKVGCEMLVEEINAAGIPLVNVSENQRLSQPWYFPRLATPEQDYVCKHHVSDSPRDLLADVAAKIAEDVSTHTVAPPIRAQSGPAYAEGSTQSLYIASHGSEAEIIKLLQDHDYKLMHVGKLNDSPSYRFLCPGSTSGVAGTVLYQCDHGTWRVYSHHGSDPLNAGGNTPHSHDAFSVFCILEHRGDTRLAAQEARRIVDPRPVIQLVGGNLHESVRAAINVLGAQDPPLAFQRGSELVRIANAQHRETQDGIEVPAGTPSILPYKTTTMTMLLSELVAWEKCNPNGEWYAVDPCRQVTTTLLDSYGHWNSIPRLRGISECPILRDDGTLCCGPGYDAATGLYVDGELAGMTLPDTVSLEDAQAAATMILNDVYGEFPFENQDIDSSVVLAYLFTLAQRPQLPTAPLFAFSATAPGTGKGLLVEASNLLVRGVDAATMPPPSGRESEDEMRKRITSFVLQGLTSLNLDNYSRPIGGDSLNTLLTTSVWSDRQLGTNNVVKLDVCCTLAATGNNVQVWGDMVRRTLLVSLDAGVEHPEHRQFAKDLPDYVRKNRRRLLTALFTILKGYQQSGCTDFDKQVLGRFEEWSRRVCHLILWLGYPNPTDSQERLQQSDPEKEKLGAVLTSWHATVGDEWLSTGDVISRAIGQSYSDPTPLADALFAVAQKAGRTDSHLLGHYLKKHKGRIVSGLRLEREERDSRSSKHGYRYRVLNLEPASANTTAAEPLSPRAEATRAPTASLTDDKAATDAFQSDQEPFPTLDDDLEINADDGIDGGNFS